MQVKDAILLKSDMITQAGISYGGRNIALPLELRDALAALGRKAIAVDDRNSLVFPFSRETARLRIKDLLAAADVRAAVRYPHVLRNTFLVSAYRARITPATIAYIAGVSFDAIEALSDAVRDVENWPDDAAEYRRLWQYFDTNDGERNGE